jgi:ferric-dicitrate binding protein FerR (iron transport regulator)
MIPKNIENSIVKYFNSEATAHEMEQLEFWLEKDKNQIVFKDYVKVNYLIDINTTSFNHTALLDKLSEEINKEKTISLRQRTQSILRYAAVFIVLIASAFVFYYLNSNNSQTSDLPINEVVLKSENGSINVLNPIGNAEIKDRNGKILYEKIDNNLVYSEKGETKSLTYNTITVPYGRQFSLELSDGTKVQLNAGTSLRFPVKFLNGKKREVYIEYGEAYFYVAKDPEHPFIVNNNNLNITVLGTQFNISAYPEDDNISTVLVEGSVELSQTTKKSENVILKPGFKALWSDNSEEFAVSRADIELHTGWRTGKIVMKSLPFSKMVKKLERHYNVIINSKDKSLNNEVITATFDEESIEDVLELINKIHPIEYNIDGRAIKILKK